MDIIQQEVSLDQFDYGPYHVIYGVLGSCVQN